jgi:hypothetical protein
MFWFYREAGAERAYEAGGAELFSSRYSSGPSRNWVKTKCAGWKRINAERYRLFEGPRKPEPTERQPGAREEARGTRPRVGAPAIAGGLRQGIARELRKHVAILEREIAELE